MTNKPHVHLQIHYSQGFVQSVVLTPTSAKGIQWSFQADALDSKLENCVEQWLEAYCQKKPSSIQIPLALHTLPPFTQKALRFVGKIPFGTISTYGQIAHLLGSPQAARAVGGACGRNPFLLFIPCHRVLDAKHELRGFSSGGISVKESLLNFEGITC